MFPALLTALFWTLSAACSARAAQHLGGTRANRWRLTIALGLLGITVLIVGPGSWNHAAWWLVASGAFGLGLGDLALFAAYQRLGARIPALLTHCLGAPFAVALEWAWLGTVLHGIELACIGVILAGVAVALWPERRGSGDQPVMTRSGLLLGIASAIGLAIASVMSRTGYAAAIHQGSPLPWLDATFLRIAGGLTVCLLWLPIPTSREAKAPDWRGGWRWLIGTATAGPAIGVAMYQWALSLLPAGIVQAVVALVPVAVAPLTRLTEGDRPSWRALGGAALAVGGVIALALTR